MVFFTPGTINTILKRPFFSHLFFIKSNTCMSQFLFMFVNHLSHKYQNTKTNKKAPHKTTISPKILIQEIKNSSFVLYFVVCSKFLYDHAKFQHFHFVDTHTHTHTLSTTSTCYESRKSYRLIQVHEYNI